MTLRFETEAPGGDTLSLMGAEGREVLSAPYEYQLWLEARPDSAVADSHELLTRPCAIVIGRDGTETRVAGILREITLLPTWPGAPVRYQAVLVPELWRATLSCRSRVFQDLNVPAIVAQVLVETGLERDRHFRFALDPGDTRSYPAREYTVQYEETDLAFVSRLLEDEGIFYYFVHGTGVSQLVIGDANSQLPTADPSELPYRAEAGDAASADAVQALSRRVRVLPRELALREYNWRTPGVPMRGEAPVDTESGFGLQSRYGDHFKTPDEGRRLARIRAEELLVGRQVGDGTCTALRLAPGAIFRLDGHPVDDMDRKYLVTETRCSTGDYRSEKNTYRKEISVIAAETPFRPARTTPRPRISGVMHAKVDGVAGQNGNQNGSQNGNQDGNQNGNSDGHTSDSNGLVAPIDELGRYKVVMPYDLAGQPGGRASRWIRMAQPSSGAGYGIHFPLHVGVEVAIAHLDGDPDRPIIIGSVPNTETVTPVTNQNATQSAIRTKAGIHVHFDDDA
jgi:type VI secretion system secreted protein VgrG